MPNKDSDSEHLAEIEDGAGCVEIWEQLSESRNDSQEPPVRDAERDR